MINLGLTRINKLLSRLPPPTWNAIHIAGTNGKGSVAAYLSSLFLQYYNQGPSLEKAPIGRFTSPHFIDRWDCITINDRPVSKSLFLSVEQQIKSLIRDKSSDGRSYGDVKTSSNINDNNNNDEDDNNSQNIVEDHQIDDNEQPTEFEILTATAFQIFTQSNCKIAIIECGLGGRLDATNSLRPENVLVSVITKIGLDHQGLLGSTVEEIAREKAGIIKPGCKVVVDGSNSQSVIDTVLEYIKSIKSSREDQDVIVTDDSSLTKALLDVPRHTRQNLQVALVAFQVSHTTTSPVKIPNPDNSEQKQILCQVLEDASRSYPGRLQHLSVAPLLRSPSLSSSLSSPATPVPPPASSEPSFLGDILVDGAHNPQSATVLRHYVDSHLLSSTRSSGTIHQAQNVTWVLAASRGKDLSEIMSILLRRGDKVVACPFGEVDGMPWVQCVEATDLAQIARQFVDDDVTVCANVVDALRTACSATASEVMLGSQQNPVVVAGSLYLVSDLLRALRDLG